MENQIVINTDNGGVNLYEARTKGLEIFGQHLDQLYQWREMIDKLEKINPKISNSLNVVVLKKLIDFDALLSVAITDLHIITSALYLSKIKLDQIFYIKHAYLVMYETYYNFETKKDFIKQNTAKASPETKKLYNDILKLWESFVDEHKIKTEVKHVRNKIAGHIDKNFNVWYTAATSLDATHTANIIIAFLNVVGLWQKLSSTLVILYKEELDAMTIESNDRIYRMIDEMGAIINKINERQPSDNKLDIDLSQFKNLLK